MAILAHSLSWALIYSLGQGVLIFIALQLFLKAIPSGSANIRYNISLTALTILLGCFLGTWWQQYHSLQAVATSSTLTVGASNNTVIILPEQLTGNLTFSKAMGYLLSGLPYVYAVGFLVMLIRLFAGFRQLFSLRRKELSTAPAAIAGLLQSLKSQLGIRGNVQVFLSLKAQVPMVIGFVKPAILLPFATAAQLNTQQLESILLHELAHIKRYDYWVNILQTVVETILFFNPFAWLISRTIRREREHACDDLVVNHTTQPLQYANALAALASYNANVSSFTIAASGNSNHLFNRIKRIVEMKKNPFSYSRMAAAIFITAAITCTLAWVAPSFAKTPGNENKNNSTTQPATATPPNEETQLAQRLIDDQMVNQIKGFSVAKIHDKLFINGTEQPKDIAAKYLQGLKGDELHVEVMSFGDRMQAHPNAGLLQNLMPATFSSPCIKTSAKKDGC